MSLPAPGISSGWIGLKIAPRMDEGGWFEVLKSCATQLLWEMGRTTQPACCPWGIPASILWGWDGGTIWGGILTLPSRHGGTFLQQPASAEHPQPDCIKWLRGTCHLSRAHLPSNRCITTKQDLFHYNLSRLDKASKLAETHIKGFSGIGAREAITFLGSETWERGSHPCYVVQEGCGVSFPSLPRNKNEIKTPSFLLKPLHTASRSLKMSCLRGKDSSMCAGIVTACIHPSWPSPTTAAAQDLPWPEGCVPRRGQRPSSSLSIWVRSPRHLGACRVPGRDGDTSGMMGAHMTPQHSYQPPQDFFNFRGDGSKQACSGHQMGHF